MKINSGLSSLVRESFVSSLIRSIDSLIRADEYDRLKWRAKAMEQEKR